MKTDVQVRGLRELEQAMNTLPDKLERNVLMAGLAAGARVIRNAARVNVPKRSGRLAKYIRTSRASSKLAVMVKAGVRKNNTYDQGWYAAIVHQGAKAHTILPKRKGGMLFFNGRFLRAIHHPGFTGVPYLENAAKANADAAVRAMGSRIAERLRDKHGLDVPAPESFDEVET
jgi:HK97 gp10 family phage protein